MSLEVAEKYVVFDIWIDGEDVVIEVQGVRADGSYWVNGFQVRIPKTQYETMTEEEITAILRQKAIEQEEELQKWLQQQATQQTATEQLRKTKKYKNLVGKEIWKRQ